MDLDSKKIATLREELRRDLEALDRVERLAARVEAMPTVADERQIPLPIRIASQDVTDEEREDITSLRGKIEAAMNSDPSVKWTNRKMLDYLLKIDFPLRAQKPVYSVGQAMQKLAENGRIRLVRKGIGNKPNEYKGKQTTGSETPSPEQGGDIPNDSQIVQ